MLRLTRDLAAHLRHPQPLPGRRRGAQLRGQRQGPARRRVRAHLDPARGGRRRRRARRGARGLPPCTLGSRARPMARSTRMQGSYLGPAFAQADIESAPRRRRARSSRRLRRRRAARAHRATRSPPARPSAGSRAGWSSGRARSAPARSSAIRAIPQMQTHAEPQDQVPRELPPVRALGAARGRRRLVRARRATAPTCCSSPTCSANRRRQMTRRGGGAVRHRQAQRARAPTFPR